jgi:hypothetical protein
LAQNFLTIDFEVIKSSFSFTLTLTKIIFCGSAGATVVRSILSRVANKQRFLAKNGHFKP